MKCALGSRKRRRIERLVGLPVRAAFVRGGWPHGWARVHFEPSGVLWVNYRTGAIEADEDQAPPEGRRCA